MLEIVQKDSNKGLSTKLLWSLFFYCYVEREMLDSEVGWIF